MDIKGKSKIVEAIRSRRGNFSGSDAKFAVSLGISGSQYSRIMSGDTERVLSDANWLSIAQKLGVVLNDAPVWNIARTPVYEYITTQLEICRTTSSSLLLCDCCDIGKTAIAAHYCRTKSNAIYVECSQAKTKGKFIKHIANEFGISSGSYSDIYDELVFYIKTIPHPIIILDEAGDLNYSAFLELKALWNATEHYCGWYMMGADGLEYKIQREIGLKKVGYAEIFSRYGGAYQKIMPATESETKQFRDLIVSIIAKSNADPDMDVRKLVATASGSPRRLYKEIMKLRMLKTQS
jgi:transcriptional regulator with XRE-family HTH domain